MSTGSKRNMTAPTEPLNTLQNTPRVDVLGLPICRSDIQALGTAIEQHINSGGEPVYQVSINAAKLYEISHNPEVAHAVEGADILSADGSSLALLSLVTNRIPLQRVPGIDLMDHLLEKAQELDWGVFLLGAKPDVLADTVRQVRQKYPGIRLAGTHHGYFTKEDELTVIEMVRSSGATLVFVALPSPKKELFIAEHLQSLGVRYAMGVGGAFDVISGRRLRAPSMIQALGAEWLWRLAQDPRGMFRRYAKHNLFFAQLAFRALTSNYTDATPILAPHNNSKNTSSSPLSDTVRHIVARSNIARRIVKHPLTQRFLNVVRAAAVVDHPLRFSYRELLSNTMESHTLNGFTIHIRHQSRDVNILNDVFGATGGGPAYAPPSEILTAKGHTFRSVLDLGGNIGLFGLYAFMEFGSSRIVSVEPDAENLRLLRLTVSKNELSSRWTILEGAAGVADRIASFASSLGPDSRIVGEDSLTDSSTTTVTVFDVMTLGSDFDLLKMDIEGSEWEILEDERFAEWAPSTVVMEWHTDEEGDADGDLACEILRKHGFKVLPGPLGGSGSAGLIWAYR